MPDVIVVGGGLAGMATAAALGSAGFHVNLFEARPFLGGRASSFPLPGSGTPVRVIDNCQHILLRCCVNLLDFLGRLEVAGQIQFHSDIHFIEPGGRSSALRAGALPPPLHFAPSFLQLPWLGPKDKFSVIRGLASLRRERGRRHDLDRITMLDWLGEKRQTMRSIERFWRPLLLSAVNEDLDRMAAQQAFQVLWLGLLAKRDAFEIGIPAVPLSELYNTEVWERTDNVSVHLGSPVSRIEIDGGAVSGVTVNGASYAADYYVCGLPFERIESVVPGLSLDVRGLEHSPITCVHLWYDRPITRLPFASMLDSTFQWFFSRDDGCYLQAVVSASHNLLSLTREQIIDLAVRELSETLPVARFAQLEAAHVVKEVKATFSARPGAEELRPAQRTRLKNLFLAGDWTRTGWPATMEGAVRSGYLAAESVAAAAHTPKDFLLPDVA